MLISPGKVVHDELQSSFPFGFSDAIFSRISFVKWHLKGHRTSTPFVCANFLKVYSVQNNHDGLEYCRSGQRSSVFTAFSMAVNNDLPYFFIMNFVSHFISDSSVSVQVSVKPIRRGHHFESLKHRKVIFFCNLFRGPGTQRFCSAAACWKVKSRLFPAIRHIGYHGFSRCRGDMHTRWNPPVPVPLNTNRSVLFLNGSRRSIKKLWQCGVEQHMLRNRRSPQSIFKFHFQWSQIPVQSANPVRLFPAKNPFCNHWSRRCWK
jgi:hypothetical protein